MPGQIALTKSETSQDRLVLMLKTAIGPRVSALLEDPKVIELMLNTDGCLWVDRLGEGRARQWL